MSIKLIIFDLDGTLADAYPAIIRSFNYAMQRLNYPKQSALTIRRAVGRGDENLLRPFVKTKDLKKALSLYRRHHKMSLLRHSRLFPGVHKVLALLKRKGYKIAIASNRPTQFSRILIRHLKLKKYFDYVLCADKLKYIKPHPEIIHKITQHFSLKSHQTVYIGDMAIDLQAGRRAKVKTIAVTTGSSSRQELEKQKPNYLLRNIRGLLKVLPFDLT